MSDTTAEGSDPTDDGLFKRVWQAIDPKGTLSARIWLIVFKVLPWAILLAIISFFSLCGWLYYSWYSWDEAVNQVETLSQENTELHAQGKKLTKLQAQDKTDFATLKSKLELKIKAHRINEASLRKELVQTKQTLDEVKRRKNTVQLPRLAEKVLKAELKNSLEKNSHLRKDLEKLKATLTAKNNAALKSFSDGTHLAMKKANSQHMAQAKQAGELRNALLSQKQMLYDTRLEMELVKAREGLEQWGQTVPLVLAYYKCKAKSGDTVKLRSLTRRRGARANLTVELVPGEGSRRGLFVANQTYHLPSGLYDIEIWKNGSRVSISKYPRYLSPNPRQQYIVCPDGRRLRIQHQGRLNLILLSSDGYKLSTLPSSP